MHASAAAPVPALHPPLPPAVVWLTGLSAAGKSSLARYLEQRLAASQAVCVLDGDVLRQSLSRDLGFSPADRSEAVRRAAVLARQRVEQGELVLVAMISPLRAQREAARQLLLPHAFHEVFVDVPLSVAEGRDPKGLYARARRGELRDFTGIDSPYEAPLAPALRLPSGELGLVECGERLLGWLRGEAGLAVVV